MKTVEEYGRDKAYELSDGTPLTSEQMETTFPALLAGALIKVEGRTPIETLSYDYALSKMNIPKPESKEQGIKLINEQLYFEQTESTPIERIASMLEYIAMKMSEGKDEFF